MNCRHCGAVLTLPVIDLGASPPSNSYLSKADLSAPEIWYPLRVAICTDCWLVQTEDFVKRDEFFSQDYAYFSSFSTSWLEHAQNYCTEMAERFELNSGSLVVEVAANDGYLLQFMKARDIPTLGIEPTQSTAEAARAKGIEVIGEFFDAKLAAALTAEGRSADLTVANNVLAHVPDINDFIRGFSLLLKPYGVATFEFPHLMKLIELTQFDTIYHEHYSYLSLIAVERIFSANGLTVFDVERLSTHGGSLRVFAQRTDTGQRPVSERVEDLLSEEQRAGVDTPLYYQALQGQAVNVAGDLLAFLYRMRAEGKTVAGYGAAAKGNTLINFAGIRPHLLPWVVDRNPNKQGKFLPGSRIPIVAEERLKAEKPDYVLILPWNLKEEVIAQLGYVRSWGGKFVTAVPALTVE